MSLFAYLLDLWPLRQVIIKKHYISRSNYIRCLYQQYDYAQVIDYIVYS